MKKIMGNLDLILAVIFSLLVAVSIAMAEPKVIIIEGDNWVVVESVQGLWGDGDYFIMRAKGPIRIMTDTPTPSPKIPKNVKMPKGKPR